MTGLPPSGTATGQARIDITRLPITGPYLLGRESELAALNKAWTDPAVHVFSIIAWGGVGKTTLVKTWLDHLDDYGGAERVFGWTFYSQGAGEDRATSADAFVDAALRFFGDPQPESGWPWDKGVRLARRVRAQKTLLVLDGLEPLQYPPGFEGAQEGRLKNPGMQALLRDLAIDNPGLCVLTSREAIADLADKRDGKAPVLELAHLSAEAGTALLRKLGVKGPETELRKAVQEVRGHALALSLLGNYLRKAHGGDVYRRAGVRFDLADKLQGGHARKVMEAYEKWFGDGVHLSILRLVGLFDRTADGPSLAALRAEPAIPGLTDALVGISEAEWRHAVGKLREDGLLAKADPAAPEALEAHPLVREHFGARLQANLPEAWRAGHERLYVHLTETTVELPETLEAMLPLYAARPPGPHCPAPLRQRLPRRRNQPCRSRRPDHPQRHEAL